MNIRTRLLVLILPTVLAVVLTTSCLTYFTWYGELISYFRATLETVVTSSTSIIDHESHEWIAEHASDPDITKSKPYMRYVKALKRVRHKLPVTSLYTVKIEPVQKGELVLRKQPPSEKNRPYDGEDPSLAFRQIYILDSGGSATEPTHRPGEEDFSESGEIKIYSTKQPFVSPIYEAKATGLRFMTAYAPILDKDDKVVGLVAADISLDVIDRKARQTQGLILFGGVITVVLIMVGIAIIAKNITQPVEELKNAALTLAAGNYGKRIEVQGPHEITELANTLNTMSECLKEHLVRLEENSLLREKMVGEVECIRILSMKLFQNVADTFSHPEFDLKCVSLIGKTAFRPSVFAVRENGEHTIILHLSQSNFLGFEGIYELILNGKGYPFCDVQLTKTKNSWHLSSESENFVHPLIWKNNEATMVVGNKPQALSPGDFIIIPNQELFNLAYENGSIQPWFLRIFKHFGEDGIETSCALLYNECLFLTQKEGKGAALQAIVLRCHT